MVILFLALVLAGFAFVARLRAGDVPSDIL